jgi:hypothetical protein
MTGTIVVVAATNSASSAGYGKVQCVFYDAAAATHPTNWRIDGGPWFSVGSAAVLVTLGAHTLSFDALLGTDVNPPNKVVTVQQSKLHVFKVNYV